MKSQLTLIVFLFSLTIILGLQCEKDYVAYIPPKEAFKEKINLFPAKKTYNINDTIWLTFTTTDKSLFDTISNQRLPTNGLEFNFRSILLPIHSTPPNFTNSYCKFILTNNIAPNYDTTQFYSMINFETGCDLQPFYNIKLGLVLKYTGIYLLNLSDVGTKFQPCANQTNPYLSSTLRFVSS